MTRSIRVHPGLGPLRWVALGSGAVLVLIASGCRSGGDPGLAREAPRARAAPPAPRPQPRMALKSDPGRGTRPAEGKDVTAKMRRWNSAAFAEPPRTFRRVPVTPKRLPQKLIRRTSTGFEVRFPSRAPITTPAVHQGRIYVSGGFQSREFYAFQATTGQQVWGVHLGDDGPSAPACEDDICVFNTESCTIFALDAVTGKLRWSHWLGDPQLSAPSIAQGRVFTSYPTHQTHRSGLSQGKSRPPGASHVIAAFELRTGKLLWQRWIDGDVMSAPVAVGKELFLTTFAGTVVELDQATGTILSATAARATSAPMVSRGALFFTQRVDRPGAADAEESMARRPRALPARRPASTPRGSPSPAPGRRPGSRPGARREREDNRGGSAESAGRPLWAKLPPLGPLPLWANLGGPAPRPRATSRERPLILAGSPYRPVKRRAAYLDKRVQSKTFYFQDGKSLDAANGFMSAPASAKAHLASQLVGQGTVSRLQSFQGSRVLHFGKRNFNTMGDELLCTDPESGAKLWSAKIQGNLAQAGGSLATPPVAAGSFLVLGLTKGEVRIVDPRTGKTSRKITVGAPVRSQPVVSGGWIYVGTTDGRLVAIDTRDKRLTGWTHWGGDAARTASR